MRHDDAPAAFGARWRDARPGCGCGRDGCDGCALTPRTVFVLQSELAWLLDMAADDFAVLGSGAAPAAQTLFAGLPPAVREWMAGRPLWVERFRRSVQNYVSRFGRPGPVDPRTLAEEVAVHLALCAAEGEPDPDGLLPPDVAAALPSLPGDYDWKRAAEAFGFSADLRRLYADAGGRLAPRGDPLHPEAWFEIA